MMLGRQTVRGNIHQKQSRPLASMLDDEFFNGILDFCTREASVGVPFDGR
jgi:hypothetical protein